MEVALRVTTRDLNGASAAGAIDHRFL